MNARYILFADGGFTDLDSNIYIDTPEDERKAIFGRNDTSPCFVNLASTDYEQEYLRQGVKAVSDTIFGLVQDDWLVKLEDGSIRSNASFVEKDVIVALYRPIYMNRYIGLSYENGVIDVANAKQEAYVQSYALVWERR